MLHAGVHSRHFGFYRLLGKTFPFAIYYLVEEAEVLVCAILDMRRDPAWIRGELETRSEKDGAERPEASPGQVAE